MKEMFCHLPYKIIKTPMSFPLMTANCTINRMWLLLPLLFIYLLTILSYGAGAENSNYVTNVGAIINANSRIGEEQKAAMEIAAEDFNNRSRTHKLVLHFRDSGRDPFHAASLAEELINEKKVEAIVGMGTWHETIQAADHANHSKIPVISFSAPVIPPPLMQRRWPYLIRLATGDSAQMKCIADIVSAYKWKRVVVVYEDDGYGGALGTLAVLSEALRDVGSRIEHRLILPLVSSPSNPSWDKEIKEIKERLTLPTVQSRVFIVLRSSLTTVTHLFKTAKDMGLVGKDSAWIITESIVCSLESLDGSDLSNMGGTLGIKTYYDKSTSSYKRFQKEFETKFSEKDDSKSKPGIYALRAYDVMTIVAQAISSSTSLQLMFNNHTGLSGKIMHLKEGQVLFDSLNLSMINIVDGKTDKEIDLVNLVRQGRNGSNDAGVTWPGNTKNDPKGWAMPTTEKPMRIVVPGDTAFNKFVKVDWAMPSADKPMTRDVSSSKFDGFCIELFKMILRNLTYDLPYVMVAKNGSYDDLIQQVQNKEFDAVIGDMTVLADRIERVDFTQPYLESGLSLIVPEKDEESTWLFLKPFTWHMWAVTGGILIYTTLVVWFLESPSNPEFGGRVKDQIGTATWFTFSSLFFAHREKLYSNLTRVVVIEWLFVALILSSSYTANLSSMLTIKRLDPNVTDIEMLRTTNATVGSDGDSFVRSYLETVLGFNSNNIVEIGPQYNVGDFKSKNIPAAFLELPYAEVFINQNCKGYLATAPTYRFGGFSFAFQRGSPITRDFSKVILQLLETGELKKLQNKWLTPNECPDNTTSGMPESLSLKSFSGLYIITGVTSTFCFLVSLVILLRKFEQQEAVQANPSPSPSDQSLWKKTVRIAGIFNQTRGLVVPTGGPPFGNVEEWSSPVRWGYTSTADTTPEHPHAFMPSAEIECIPQELIIEQRQ